MREEKPTNEFCYNSSVFGEGIECPDLDDAVHMKPKCLKYNQLLGWTKSGRVLKCEECLNEK